MPRVSAGSGFGRSRIHGWEWGLRTAGFAVLCLALALPPAAAGEKVAAFTGDDSYALVGTPEALQIPSNHPFTIEAWVCFNTQKR